MTNFDILNCKNFDVFTTKSAGKYIFIDGGSYNMVTGDFVIHNRNGHVDKAKDDKKDIVKVERLDALPDANVISETLKVFKGIGTNYTFETKWQAEDPKVTQAKKVVADAQKAYDDAVRAMQDALRDSSN